MKRRQTIQLQPAVMRPDAAESRASLRHLLLAPHRLAFFTGTVMLLVVSAAWLLMLAAAQTGTAIVTVSPPTIVHAFLFAAAYMPIFIAGFMFTAGPRWLQVAAPGVAKLRWPLLLHIAGVTLLLVGTAINPAVSALGAVQLALAWALIGNVFAAMLRASRTTDRLHARCIVAFWTVGIVAVLLYAAAATDRLSTAAVAAWLLVCAGVAPITATVAHRVLPFFTSGAVTSLVPWRPNWALGLMLASLFVFGALQVCARTGAFEPEPLALLTLVLLVPAGVAMTALAIRWGLVQSLRGRSLRLLAMLHLAFLWIPIALLLAAADAALRLTFGASAGLGLAPLHALTVGFLGSMLFAMTTRVIRGHGGIALVADTTVWVLFCLLQVSTLLRIASPIGKAAGGLFVTAAAIAWTGTWFAWAFVHVPILLKPRADGRPG